MELGQQTEVECARSHILHSSAVALEHRLCAPDLGLLGPSAMRLIPPSALERTGRDQMCILANSTL